MKTQDLASLIATAHRTSLNDHFTGVLTDGSEQRFFVSYPDRSSRFQRRINLLERNTINGKSCWQRSPHPTVIPLTEGQLSELDSIPQQ